MPIPIPSLEPEPFGDNDELNQQAYKERADRIPRGIKLYLMLIDSLPSMADASDEDKLHLATFAATSEQDWSELGFRAGWNGGHARGAELISTTFDRVAAGEAEARRRKAKREAPSPTPVTGGMTADDLIERIQSRDLVYRTDLPAPERRQNYHTEEHVVHVQRSAGLYDNSGMLKSGDPEFHI